MSAHRLTEGIAVRGLSKSFGAVPAVDNLTFDAAPGTVTGFLGPNGAGKSTTLRMVLGLIRPDCGTSTIDGQSYHELPVPAAVAGAALDAEGFHPGRAGRTHLRIYCHTSGVPLQRADDVLDMVGLANAAHRRIGGYSLGMRQRLALAVALLGDPRTLILDEPANGLDPEGIVWMRTLLRQFADEGRTVLVSSHVLTEMQHLADNVVIIDRGRLLYQGPVNQAPVIDVRTPQADVLRVSLAHRDGVTIDQPAPDRLLVTGLDATAVGRTAFEAGIELAWLAERTGNLENLFFALTAAER
ncbi:ABC-2 type transport system ATP-binding protein [Kribbella sp. VKM Ac-2571]|uniref:ATP-binding cassette domain-containing protein n=1 Tax=Kribbella sp. VKM Ac-2571 TaxID=2512222 RepID=UPI00106088DA|nr:ATP-binding cassette domain-containing protein [Kribbella sp. VKM Ac-2571]TDO51094.1 ABC-2 type transport system ATP-binding protein [Kribbella sp. VKM Ac-2571]